MSEDQSYQSLKDAIEGGDLDKVKDLVENGNFDLNGPNLEENEKPLIQAVISQSPFLVEYLIEKGAKVPEDYHSVTGIFRNLWGIFPKQVAITIHR